MKNKNNEYIYSVVHRFNKIQFPKFPCSLKKREKRGGEEKESNTRDTWIGWSNLQLPCPPSRLFVDKRVKREKYRST